MTLLKRRFWKLRISASLAAAPEVWNWHFATWRARAGMSAVEPFADMLGIASDCQVDE